MSLSFPAHNRKHPYIFPKMVHFLSFEYVNTPKREHFYFPMLLLLGLSLGACGRGKLQVETAAVEQRTVYARVVESGTIEPTISLPIAPDVSGEIVALPVKEGQSVKKGDLLVTIRPDDYRAQLEQAEASLSRAKAAYLQAQASEKQADATRLQDSVTLFRTQNLFKEEVISQVDLENAQLSYKVSRSQYESAKFNVQAAYYQYLSAGATRKQARQSLDRTNIYATIDGIITELNVELGQRVVGTSMMAGTEILKIADLSSMDVNIEVNENDIIHVEIGDSARVEVDAYQDQIFYGSVTEVAYSASGSGALTADQVTNFEVKVNITPSSYDGIAPKQASPFRPGMSALVEIYTDKVEDATVVPVQAVALNRRDDQTPEEIVFLLQGGKVHRQPIQLGISDDQYIQVETGLDMGQAVITSIIDRRGQRSQANLGEILTEDLDVEVRQKDQDARTEN